MNSERVQDVIEMQTDEDLHCFYCSNCGIQYHINIKRKLVVTIGNKNIVRCATFFDLFSSEKCERDFLSSIMGYSNIVSERFGFSIVGTQSISMVDEFFSNASLEKALRQYIEKHNFQKGERIMSYDVPSTTTTNEKIVFNNRRNLSTNVLNKTKEFILAISRLNIISKQNQTICHSS